MAVRQARGVQARPGRAPAAVSRRTGPRFCGARCAPLQGVRGLAQGVQNAETVAANIVRHGRSSSEGRTGPAGTCPRRGFVANGSAFLWRTLCAAQGGTGFGAGRTKRRDRSGEHCSPWPFVRRGAYRPGRDVCPAAVSRRTGPHFLWRTMCAATGARVLAQVRGFAAHRPAFLWRTMCAATGGTGFGAGPRFRGEQGRILWRTLCAATGRRVCGARGGAGFFLHRSRFHCTLPRWSSGGAQVEFR